MFDRLSKKSSLIISGILIIALVLLDQLTKLLAVANLRGKTDIVLLKDIFQLHYLENTGAAFSMMEGQQVFFAISTPILVLIMLYILYKMPLNHRYKLLDYIIIFVTAGAVGNYIDRISKGYVVDFLYFSLINFPVFNVADIYVTCSVILLIFLVLFYYKDEDFDEIGKSVFSWKK